VTDAPPVALLGLRGAGKSTVGRALAERLGRPFVDLDAELAARDGLAGERAGELLARVGEPRFRDLEEAALARALARADGPVIATGGGVVERAANRTALASGARCVWLRARPEALHERLVADPAPRPALTELGPLEELRSLAARRGPHLAALAEATVEVEGREVSTLVEEILAILAR